jgi:hypothetical protein
MGERREQDKDVTWTKERKHEINYSLLNFKRLFPKIIINFKRTVLRKSHEYNKIRKSKSDISKTLK